MGVLSAKLPGEPTAMHDSVRANCQLPRYITAAHKTHLKLTMRNPHAGASKRYTQTASCRGSCLNLEALTARPSAFAAARCS